MGKKKSKSGASKSGKAARFSSDSATATSQESKDLVNVALVFLGLAIFAAVVAFVWQRVGPLVMQDEVYRLDLERIHVSEQPTWVRADVRAEVVQAAGLDANRSVIDSKLTAEIAAAFTQHPWVDEVVSVAKRYPAEIDVELTYRRPVAVVKLEGTTKLELHPVDITGVRLPASAYSANELRSFPRISGIAELPPLGQPAEDPAVSAAAQLAALLEDDWQAMQFALIVPPSRNAASTGGVFSLVTRAGSTVIWGSVDSEPLAASPLSKARVAFLRSYLAQHKSLDGRAGPHTLDLRKLPSTDEKSRTALKP